MRMSITLPDELKFIQNSMAPQKISETSLVGKVCVITGTTSGIGYVTAHRLAKFGAHLVMVVRNKVKGEKVKQEIEEKYHTPCDLLIADFSAFEDVYRVSKQIIERYASIDVLILNAGTFLQKKTFTDVGIETTFHGESSFSLFIDLPIEGKNYCISSFSEFSQLTQKVIGFQQCM